MNYCHEKRIPLGGIDELWIIVGQKAFDWMSKITGCRTVCVGAEDSPGIEPGSIVGVWCALGF